MAIFGSSANRKEKSRKETRKQQRREAQNQRKENRARPRTSEWGQGDVFIMGVVLTLMTAVAVLICAYGSYGWLLGL